MYLSILIETKNDSTIVEELILIKFHLTWFNQVSVGINNFLRTPIPSSLDSKYLSIETPKPPKFDDAETLSHPYSYPFQGRGCWGISCLVHSFRTLPHCSYVLFQPIIPSTWHPSLLFSFWNVPFSRFHLLFFPICISSLPCYGYLK